MIDLCGAGRGGSGPKPTKGSFEPDCAQAARSAAAARMGPRRVIGVSSRCVCRKANAAAALAFRSAPGGDVLEGDLLVEPDIARQAEDPFGDDVAQDLVRAAAEPQARREQQAVLEGGFLQGVGRIVDQAELALQLDG